MSQRWTMGRYQAIADVPELSNEDFGEPLRILMLADDGHAANVVQDHINAFKHGSRHNITVINPINENVSLVKGMIHFDAVLIHYSIYILGKYFLPDGWARYVRLFPGLKAQIIQDECRHVNAMKQRMAELGIRVVFSSLEVDNLKRVYGGDMQPDVSFFSCLPGYVASNFFRLDPPSIAERPFDIVYRGRSLPAQLGRHAQEKKKIGEQMLRAADRFGLKVDISSDEHQRIYGAEWPAFLMSGKTTLGVEGGVSIFDFEGNLEAAVQQYCEKKPKAGFEKIWNKVNLAAHEGNVVHKTITPKLLEAIAAKTVLVLYPGYYRGILKPGVHYIELARNGANMAEVVAHIRDHDYLQAMADFTHEDILSRRELSKEYFVAKVDVVLANAYVPIAEYDFPDDWDNALFDQPCGE